MAFMSCNDDRHHNYTNNSTIDEIIILQSEFDKFVQYIMTYSNGFFKYNLKNVDIKIDQISQTILLLLYISQCVLCILYLPTICLLMSYIHKLYIYSACCYYLILSVLSSHKLTLYCSIFPCTLHTLINKQFF